MTIEVYKIRRKSDGLFSTGGENPSFNKRGKTWSARGHITSHLSQLSSKTKNLYYNNCEVVCFEIEQFESSATDVLEWKPTEKTIRAKELQAQRELELQIRRDLSKIERLQKELANLKSMSAKK
jgi:septin family protein